MATLTASEMVVWLEQNQFLTPAQIVAAQALIRTFPDIHALAKELVQRDWLTPFQVNQILQGKHDELVLGDYRLRERIGVGAMGQVYKAWSLRLHRVVAIKTILQDRVNSKNAMERFRREVQAAAQLAHPNIALVRDAGEENNQTFLVMDFIDGFNLSDRVKKHGAIPITEAVEYTRQAALGLQHAFERGIVHRDIKPANLMVVGDARPLVKILDFGLARYDSEQENAARLTQMDNLLGTIDYVAPEQAQYARGADIRADIYSLGCTLFYLLTATPPFAGESVVEKLGPRISGEAPWVRAVNSEVPPGLEEIVRKMMARLPDDRYQTPMEVAQALAPYAVAMTLPAAPTASKVVMAMPVQATAVGPDGSVPMARPILAQPIEASPEPTPAFTGMSPAESDVPSANSAALPGEPMPRTRLPMKLMAMLGAGLVLTLVLSLGTCFSFWPPAKPVKNASIIITEAKLSTPNKTVRPGDTKFVLVYIERVNFEGPVSVSLQDLPPGVVGKTKVIPANNQSADVSFTVSFGTDPIETKIRIVAECEAPPASGEFLLPFTIVPEKKAKK